MTKRFIFGLIIKRIVLLIALYPAMSTLGIMLNDLTFEAVSRVFFRFTYIETIDTPSYANRTKEVLEEFNSMGDNKIIRFDKIKFGRPVKIFEMTDLYTNLKPQTLGTADVALSDCIINIKRNRNPLDFREILLHEYLHCMGYDHVPNQLDLMYESLNPVDKEDNIRQYAKKVKKKFYE